MKNDNKYNDQKEYKTKHKVIFYVFLNMDLISFLLGSLIRAGLPYIHREYFIVTDIIEKSHLIILYKDLSYIFSDWMILWYSLIGLILYVVKTCKR